MEYRRGKRISVIVASHIVNPWHRIGSILALDDRLLVFSVPVFKLSVELEGDDLHVAGIMVPGEVAVYTDHIHKRSLEEEKNNV